MRFLTIGAGAIGTYIGGSLALKGEDVVFLERPDVVAEIRSRGLTLSLEDGEHHIPNPKLVTDWEQILALEPFDVTIYALKSYHTPAFIQALPPNRNSLPPFLCLSNGVDNEATLAQALGSDNVIAGTVTSAVGRHAAGNIVLERLRGVGVAEGHPLSMRLAAVLDASGLNAETYPDAAAMKWSKMLTNLLANASSAILDMSPAEIFAHSGLYRLEIAQLREALAVMRAQQIGVTNLPGTPVKALAFAVRHLPLWLSRPLLNKAVAGGRGGKMPSFHIDLHSGRKGNEVAYLNGAVVRAGQRVGVDTPVNATLTETLMSLGGGEMPLSSFRNQPEKLLARVARVT
jgi:2-dehydropantoate 2-reductase